MGSTRGIAVRLACGLLLAATAMIWLSGHAIATTIVSQDAELVAPDRAANDTFGSAVDLSADLLVVGSPLDDDGGSNAGSVYVYRNVNSTWSFEAKLIASDATANAHFGAAVATDGTNIVIGAPIGNSFNGAGQAYVFTHAGGTWVEQAILRASDNTTGDTDRFGDDVAISGTTALVGARGATVSGLTNAGAAYAFVNSGGVWSEQQRIFAHLANGNGDAGANFQFGSSVAIDGDSAVIGAPGYSRTQTSAGAAYMFQRSGGTWSAQRAVAGIYYLGALGTSVAVAGDLAVAGGPGEDNGIGHVHMFRHSGTTWTQEGDVGAHQGFGSDVDVSGNTVLAGDAADDIDASVTGSGSISLIVQGSNGTWAIEPRILSAPHAANDHFGTSVALDGTTAVAGAPRRDEGLTDAGAAFVFTAQRPPIAKDDRYDVTIDTPLSIAAPGLLANDVDPDNAMTAAVVTNPSHGAVTVNSDGSFTYTPAAGYAGNDSFAYKACDAVTPTQCGQANALLTIHQPDRAPTPAADSYALDEDTVLNVAAPGVLTNDSDPDGDTLHAGRNTANSGPKNGSLTFNSDGSFVYAPVHNYFGPDAFTYFACDPLSSCVEATVSLTVRPVPDPPFAGNDHVVAFEDTPRNVAAWEGVLVNDGDPDGEALTPSLASDPMHGTLDFHSDGSFVYTPAAGYLGSDSFTYEVCDPTNRCTTATVSIDVLTADRQPKINDDNYVTTPGTTISVDAPGVLANDTDPDGDALLPTQFDQPSHGRVSLNDDGSFVYTPDAGFIGSDSFHYEACDSSAKCGTATVTIVVHVPDSGPAAGDDTYTTREDVTLVVATPGVLANDTDSDGDTLTAVATSSPSHGAVTLHPDGSLTYVPDQFYIGDDTFTYRACDPGGLCAGATVHITVTPDPAPFANDDFYTTTQDDAVTVAPPGVLTNDGDPEGQPLTATATSSPAHGTVTLHGDGSLTYTPATGYFGEDSFTYKACDRHGVCAGATVHITVTEDPQPSAADDHYTTNEDKPLSVAAPGVLANDADPEGQTLEAFATSTVANGTATLTAGGGLTYTPANGFSGDDSFTYQACDPHGGCATATVTITVIPDGAPLAVDDRFTVDSYATLNVRAPGTLQNDSDPDGDTLQAVLVRAPLHGTVVFHSDGSFAYTPKFGYHGNDTFTYRADDGRRSSNTATVTIAVGCGENGLNALKSTPAKGLASGTIRDKGEPAVANVDPSLAPTVHQVNCSVVVPVEKDVNSL
ncbi:MAG TPA: Ig-like domain-containing protein [Acidimicrobiales bacterium]|nr:Ig-like domain-containing protein [Acidimicrobiales bacterium]